MTEKTVRPQRPYHPLAVMPDDGDTQAPAAESAYRVPYRKEPRLEGSYQFQQCGGGYRVLRRRAGY